jgi:hypothetical protein
VAVGLIFVRVGQQPGDELAAEGNIAHGMARRVTETGRPFVFPVLGLQGPSKAFSSPVSPVWALNLIASPDGAGRAVLERSFNRVA